MIYDRHRCYCLCLSFMFSPKMNSLSLYCCVCLKKNAIFVPVTQNYIINEDIEETILILLQRIVPEVDWQENFTICTDCFDTLCKVIDFRNLCLKSNSGKPESSIKHNDGVKEKEKCRKYRCKGCNRSFKFEVNLKRHSVLCDGIARHTGSYKDRQQSKVLQEKRTPRCYRCGKCGRMFGYEKRMKQHSVICDGIKRHSLGHFKNISINRCVKCFKCYSTSKSLKEHEKRCKRTRQKKFQTEKCFICYEILKSEKLKVEHVQNVHNINLKIENTCALCYAACETQEGYRTHLQKVHNDELYQITNGKTVTSCNVCLKKFDSVTEVEHHFEKLHGKDNTSLKPFGCILCGSHFVNKNILVRHIKSHSDRKEHVCTICGKEFKMRPDLKVHELIHKNKRKHVCKHCGKAYKTHNNLRSHIFVVHTDPSHWKYNCTICARRFALKGSYEEHCRRHRNERNWVCEICDKHFISKSELKHHKSHKKRHYYKCKKCSEEFFTKRKMEEHFEICEKEDGVEKKSRLGSSNELWEIGGNKIEIEEWSLDEENMK